MVEGVRRSARAHILMRERWAVIACAWAACGYVAYLSAVQARRAEQIRRHNADAWKRFQATRKQRLEWPRDE